jgi:hypothetical protein
MCTRYSRLFSLVILMASAWQVHAEGDQNVNSQDCHLTSGSQLVKIVVCSPGLVKEAWQQAGQEACGTQSRCNVWIWDEAKKAPESAPEVDKDLTEDQARDAVAVWVNDSKQLVLLEAVTKTPLR